MSKHSSTGREWGRIAAGVKERDGYECVYKYQGCTLTNDLTVDHVLAKVHGGTDDEDNLVTACRRCNGKKKDKKLMRINYVDTAWMSA